MNTFLPEVDFIIEKGGQFIAIEAKLTGAPTLSGFLFITSLLQFRVLISCPWLPASGLSSLKTRPFKDELANIFSGN